MCGAALSTELELAAGQFLHSEGTGGASDCAIAERRSDRNRTKHAAQDGESSCVIERHGVFTLTIAGSHHTGALATYLPRLTERGLLPILSCSGPAAVGVAPFGGTRSLFTPNPIAAGIPATGDPVLLDISASITTNNRAKQLAKPAASSGLGTGCGGSSDRRPSRRCFGRREPFAHRRTGSRAQGLRPGIACGSVDSRAVRPRTQHAPEGNAHERLPAGDRSRCIRRSGVFRSRDHLARRGVPEESTSTWGWKGTGPGGTCDVTAAHGASAKGAAVAHHRRRLGGLHGRAGPRSHDSMTMSAARHVRLFPATAAAGPTRLPTTLLISQ
ncbi:MAG: hypothetical protein EOP82_08125 [Variovorax sp.]|nr:MAG: hypothetical protein EOP82_08125 [Variovorax sp.]